MNSGPTRPVLRYHGAKWTLAPWIIRHLPPHRCFVEPYGGSAAVLLRKPRSYSEVYNDLDVSVVSLFRILRDRLQAAELERLLRLTPYSRREYREAFEEAAEPLEGARRLLLRSFAGFAGVATHGHATGFRCDTTRRGTTPAGDWRGWPDHLQAITERLQGVVIEEMPAVDLIPKYDGPDTCHYVDPPYLQTTRDAGEDYRFEMTDADHCELAEVLWSVRGMVVLSGYPCALYDELFPGWEQVTRKTRADSAALRTECLWLNPAATQARHQLTLPAL